MRELSTYICLCKEGNPEAKFMENKEIRNWDDIVMLCGRDRAIGEGVETFDEAAETMAYEGYDEEISTHSVQSKNGMGRKSTLSATKSKKLPSQLSNTLKVRRRMRIIGLVPRSNIEFNI
ncbi:hypothetical protein Leryth_026065 [Lithospermum erythrorhizon]|nr:hypothetical protein Leryth_026065 [Lithospermum erythrorhizon]